MKVKYFEFDVLISAAVGMKILFIANTIIIVHYIVETFYFRALNLAIMLPLLFTFAGNVALFYISPKPKQNAPPVDKKTM